MSQDINLINLVADIPEDVPDGTVASIELVDGIGDPPISNTFTAADAKSLRPKLIGGKVKILRKEEHFLGEPFVRGDPNEDGSLNIADCIFILGYLFAHSQPPRCLDSADVDDNGRINISDPIYLLTYLWRFEVSPPFPFPSPGLDPTEDSLPECER